MVITFNHHVALLYILATGAFLFTYFKVKSMFTRNNYASLFSSFKETQQAVMKAIAVMQESINNHVTLGMTKLYLNTMVITPTHGLAVAFLSYLKSLDMQHIASNYKILVTSKTYAEALQRCEEFTGFILAADVNLLKSLYSYIAVDKKDEKKDVHVTQEDLKALKLKSFPKAFIDVLLAENTRIDDGFKKELASYGNMPLDPPILKEILMHIYQRKLMHYQIEYLKMESTIMKEQSDHESLELLLSNGSYSQLLERLSTAEMDTELYRQVILASAMYSDFEKIEHFVSTEDRRLALARINSQLLYIINKLNEH